MSSPDTVRPATVPVCQLVPVIRTVPIRSATSRLNCDPSSHRTHQHVRQPEQGAGILLAEDHRQLPPGLRRVHERQPEGPYGRLTIPAGRRTDLDQRVQHVVSTVIVHRQQPVSESIHRRRQRQSPVLCDPVLPQLPGLRQSPAPCPPPRAVRLRSPLLLLPRVSRRMAGTRHPFRTPEAGSSQGVRAGVRRHRSLSEHVPPKSSKNLASSGRRLALRGMRSSQVAARAPHPPPHRIGPC